LPDLGVKLGLISNLDNIVITCPIKEEVGEQTEKDETLLDCILYDFIEQFNVSGILGSCRTWISKRDS